jgi:hypothetical protein
MQEITIPDSIYSLQPIGTSRGKEVFQDNPFIVPGNFVVQIRKDLSLVAGGLSITDEDSEEIAAGVIGKIQYVDTEQFLKLYTRNVSVLFDLNVTAQKVLIAVFAAVQSQAKDKAHIFLNYNTALEYYQLLGFQKKPSRSSFAQGIKQLIKMGFLAAHYRGEGWLWFNPNLIFNGDRVRFVNEYRVKRKDEKNIEQLPLPSSSLPKLNKEKYITNELENELE